MENYKTFKICLRNGKRKSIIGSCTFKGIAMIWAEAITCLLKEEDEIYILNKETGEVWFLDRKTNKWTK